MTSLTPFEACESAASLSTRVGGLSAVRLSVARRAACAKVMLVKARTEQADIDAVQRAVQYVAARVQTGFGNYIGALVTKALHHVFPERRKDHFVVRFRENRGKTECELLLRTEGGEEAHPFDCSGGGVWDTLAFALRCAELVLEQPAPSRILFLDEPFKFLHGAQARRKAMRMLYNTCASLGIQAVVVHQGDAGDEEEDSLGSVREESGIRVYEVLRTGYEQAEIKEALP